jgi:cytoskeleton protein RodZ
MSTGERLRRARVDAGKTLDQVAAETKIQLWILEAIERDDLSRLPGGVFIRGYLTAFACAVGVNPSEVLAAYSPETPPPPAVPPVALPPPDPNEGSTTPLWQYVVIVAMVLAAAVVWRNMTRSSSEVATALAPPPSATAPSTPAPSPAPSTTPSPAPDVGLPTASGATATAGATLPAAPAEPHDGDRATITDAPLVVQLHANGEVWIEADADGERKAYQLFEQGQELRLEGQKEIRLLVGDAAAVTYTINGKPGRPLGGTGVVRQFVVSPGNIESLTGPAPRTDG